METQGKIVLQVVAMPKDTNAFGDLFGGWILGEMDLAGGVLAGEVAKNRVVTVALDKMAFVRPVFVGDVLKCFASVQRIGNTSVTILVEAFATRQNGQTEKVTEGSFTYVSIDKDRKPQRIDKP